jgi:antitoxin ParD1/3/4
MKQRNGSISLTLSGDLDRFVRQQTKSGKYASVAEVVEEALRLLEAAEGIRDKRLRDVKAKLAEGLTSLDRGEGIDGEDAFRELLESLSEPRKKNTRK